MRGWYVVVVLLAAGAPALGGDPVAAGPGERIREFDVRLTIERSGDLDVVETITYDFGGAARRGIVREIPVRVRYDDTHDRVFPVSAIAVATSPGAPDAVQVTEDGGLLRIRVGDPDVRITGTHTYEVRYRLGGALNGFPSHDELFWDALGASWTVPVDRFRAEVVAPVAITEALCYRGPAGSRLPCDRAEVDGAAARFDDADLAARSAVSVVVALPRGAVDPPVPVLEERWSLARAFAVTPVTVGAAALALFGSVGLVAWGAWTRGRDRKWVGSPVDQVYGNESGGSRRVPLGARPTIPVEYVPPEGLRPGQVGTLVDETAHPTDVTASIVDLAGRGYLVIEEVEAPRRFRRGDWRLSRTPEDDGDLHAYEARLLDALFADGDEVRLSALREQFAPRLREVQDLLYDDVVDQGWFLRRPDRVRATWQGIGFVALLLALGVATLLVIWTGLGLVGLALVLGAVSLLAAAGRMPHRTPAGTAMLRRVQGFRRFIETSEAERARFAEDRHLFTEYLPYAIVFGCVDQWARTFAGLADEPVEVGWYRGGALGPAAFAASLDGFSVATAGTLTATPAGSGGSGFSGGGFSGGGVGGGGGGSW